MLCLACSRHPFSEWWMNMSRKPLTWRKCAIVRVFNSLIPIILPLNSTLGHNILPFQSFSDGAQLLPLNSSSGTPVWDTFLSGFSKQSSKNVAESLRSHTRAQGRTINCCWLLRNFYLCFFFFYLRQFEWDGNFSGPKDCLSFKLMLFWPLNAKRGSDFRLGHLETSGWHPMSKCQPSNTKHFFSSPAGVLSGTNSYPYSAGIASAQVLKSVDYTIKLERFLGHR